MAKSTRLIAPTSQHLLEIMTWFNSEQELRLWAGPSLAYPFDQTTFERDLNLDSLASFSLISRADDLLGFGQCYLRVDRCHLGRLVVSPKFRGKNVAASLIQLLINFGLQKFDAIESSLFVYSDNQAAIKAYLKCGFKFLDYPEKMPMDNCRYMVRSH